MLLYFGRTFILGKYSNWFLNIKSTQPSLSLFIFLYSQEKMYEFEQNKKNNLILYGVTAKHPETSDSLKQRIAHLFRDHLNIRRDVNIQRATRIHQGAYSRILLLHIDSRLFFGGSQFFPQYSLLNQIFFFYKQKENPSTYKEASLLAVGNEIIKPIAEMFDLSRWISLEWSPMSSSVSAQVHRAPRSSKRRFGLAHWRIYSTETSRKIQVLSEKCTVWNDNRFVRKTPALYVLTKNLQDFPAVS